MYGVNYRKGQRVTIVLTGERGTITSVVSTRGYCPAIVTVRLRNGEYREVSTGQIRY